MFLGDYIVIERQTGPFSFECESVSSGTPFTAEVDEDKRTIFMNFTFPDQHPAACRFLRPDGDQLRCTIHRDSPVQCKVYRCVVMRVTNAHGTLIGTVRGTLDLHSDNPDLRALWEEVVRRRPKDDSEAEPWIAGFLQEKGYRVD
jgi:Fe-S-cluster containining protein